MSVPTPTEKRQSINRAAMDMRWNDEMLEERCWSICRCSPSRLKGNSLDRFYRYMQTLQNLKHSR